MQILFYVLFSVTPLILWPRTSELFEFNKMIFVYLLTTLITAVWIIRCLIAKKLIFRRTTLDTPLLIFLASQILSTIFSIDQRTSLLGYYSRFNGGLLSVICYTLLYWAFVSNMDHKKTLCAIRYTLYASVLVSIIAVLEHFGINVTCALMRQGFGSCWIQDVQNRVFSTLGQPNWLATWITALIPIAFALILDTKKIKRVLLYLLSLLLFTTLLFTKSRSGLLGFVSADLIFWGYVLFKYRKHFLVPGLILNSLFIILFLVISSPLIINHQPLVISNAPALEVGGTESGTIRKIVWKGALKVWKNYPLFGSGVETFAFSYYKFRPVEHNLVSEWDFLYNKAHNEYLNYLATTGLFGLGSYLFLIGAVFYSIINEFRTKNYELSRNLHSSNSIVHCSILAGYTSILISNFFGFSTVSTQLEFFLFPALAVALGEQRIMNYELRKQKLINTQKSLILVALSSIFIVLYSISKYWYADTLFAKGDISSLQKAATLSPKEPIFHSKLAEVALSISESEKAIELSPANVNLLRNQAGIYLKLAISDPKYLGSAKNTLLKATAMAPTDAKLLYNLALVYIRTGEIDKSIKLLEKVIEMKSNYQEAKYLYDIITR